MRSIRRKLAVLVVPIGLAVAGLAVSSHDNPAAAASARSAKAKAATANRGETRKFEHQQCSWEHPCAPISTL